MVTLMHLTSRNLEEACLQGFAGMMRTELPDQTAAVIMSLCINRRRFAYPLLFRINVPGVEGDMNDEMDLLFPGSCRSNRGGNNKFTFAAETEKARNGMTIPALPVEETLQIMRKYNRLKE
ncbi:MAG: hypothetical protein R2758_09935 [Bacteroidales bacterium]